MQPKQITEDGSLNESGREALSRAISKVMMLRTTVEKSKVTASIMPVMEVSQVRSDSPDSAARPLSNMYMVNIRVEGMDYISVEHYYQI